MLGDNIPEFRGWGDLKKKQQKKTKPKPTAPRPGEALLLRSLWRGQSRVLWLAWAAREVLRAGAQLGAGVVLVSVGCWSAPLRPSCCGVTERYIPAVYLPNHQQRSVLR